jgi:hypothetical protein
MSETSWGKKLRDASGFTAANIYASMHKCFHLKQFQPSPKTKIPRRGLGDASAITVENTFKGEETMQSSAAQLGRLPWQEQPLLD